MTQDLVQDYSLMDSFELTNGPALEKLREVVDGTVTANEIAVDGTVTAQEIAVEGTVTAKEIVGTVAAKEILDVEILGASSKKLQLDFPNAERGTLVVNGRAEVEGSLKADYLATSTYLNGR